MIDINWFNDNFLTKIGSAYKISYSSFAGGDFGDLERIEIEGKGKGGTFDFWSLGWLDLHLVNYETGDELMNILLDPHQNEEKVKAFSRLQELL